MGIKLNLEIMRKVITIVVVALGTLFYVNAQGKMMKPITKIIALEQSSGEFTQKEITVSEGTYVFEIANNAVGHNVGFVLVKKVEDISNPENHIQTAYVKEQVANGAKQMANPTTLVKGEYVYFCPLNPTATDNTLTVK